MFTISQGPIRLQYLRSAMTGSRASFLLSPQHDHILHMTGLWEEVDGLDGAEVVVSGEDAEVAGEGGGVAGDIEDLGDAGGDQGIEEFAVAAFAWGIDDGELGAVAFAEPFRQPGFGFGGGKVGIGEAVSLGGFPGIGDGLADAVDAVKGLVLLRDETADGADAAVEVENGCVRCEGPDHLTPGLVEHFGLGGVDLKERRRRKFISQITEGLGNGPGAGEQGISTTEHEPGIGVDIVPDADDLGPFFGKAPGEGALAEALGGGDKNDHELTGSVALADHDLVDIRDAGGGDGILEPVRETADLLTEKEAVGGGHEVMAAFFIKAKAGGAAVVVGMKNAFVAIAPGPVHGLDRQDVGFELADAGEGVAYLLGLDLCLQGIAGRHEGAAAAYAAKRTRRGAAGGVGCNDSLKPGVNDAFFALAEADGDSLIRQGAGHKNDLSFGGAANAAAVMRKAGDGEFGMHGIPPDQSVR